MSRALRRYHRHTKVIAIHALPLSPPPFPNPLSPTKPPYPRPATLPPPAASVGATFSVSITPRQALTRTLYPPPSPTPAPQHFRLILPARRSPPPQLSIHPYHIYHRPQPPSRSPSITIQRWDSIISSLQPPTCRSYEFTHCLPPPCWLRELPVGNLSNDGTRHRAWLGLAEWLLFLLQVWECLVYLLGKWGCLAEGLVRCMGEEVVSLGLRVVAGTIVGKV